MELILVIAVVTNYFFCQSKLLLGAGNAVHCATKTISNKSYLNEEDSPSWGRGGAQEHQEGAEGKGSVNM